MQDRQCISLLKKNMHIGSKNKSYYGKGRIKALHVLRKKHWNKEEQTILQLRLQEQLSQPASKAEVEDEK